MKTINEVEIFLRSFCHTEYELIKSSYTSDIEKSEHYSKANSLLENNGFNLDSHFSNTLIWHGGKSQKEKDHFINNILRERNLFVIEEYKKPKHVYTSEIKSEQLFACYVSDKSNIGINLYSLRIFIGESVNNELKILTAQLEKPGKKYPLQWIDNNAEIYGQDILEMGTLVSKIKFTSPTVERHLMHYNA